MPVLDPFVADAWIVKVLKETEGKTALVNGVLVPADAVVLVGDRIHPLRDDLVPIGWPYIVYSGANEFDRYANEITLARGEFTVRQVMREDLLGSVGASGDVEDFNRAGYIAIHAAFDGCEVEAATGVIHGCEVLRPFIRLYGEAGRKISEMGVVAKIVST